MKHLFYIHSALNYILSKQIIKCFNLNESDCVLLYDRIDPFPNESVLQLYFPHDPLPAAASFGVQLAFWRSWQRVHTFDQKIAQITQDQPFTFYAIFSKANFFYLTVSHPSCQGFFYTEEGAAALNLLGEAEKQKKNDALRGLLYTLNFPGRAVPSGKPFHDLNHPKFKGVLASCDAMFPGFPSKTVIGFPNDIKQLKQEYEHVLVLDGVADFGLISHENYFKAVALLPLWFIQNKIERVHVKYQKKHHIWGDSKETVKAIFDNFKAQIEFIEIPPTDILEVIAINTTANFYINMTSTGFYAFLAGRSVYTWRDFLKRFDTNFKIAYNQPEEYSKALIYMELTN